MNILIDDRTENKIINIELINDIDMAIKTCLEIEGLEDSYEISVSFVTKDEIKELNNKYRQKDEITDVLSFPLCEDEFVPGSMLGDIVICIDRAKEQANELGHSLRREIIYLVIHSVFHLLGYDHMEIDDKSLMREKEKEAIRSLGVYRNE